MGIQSLKGKIAKDIWSSGQSKRLPRELWRRSRLLLELINASSSLGNLRIKGTPPDIGLHKLKGNFKNKWSVTIHKGSGWRIIFIFLEREFSEVEILDTHGD